VLSACLSTLWLFLQVVSAGGAGERGLDVPSPGGDVVVGLLSDPKTLNPLVATSIESRTIIDLLFIKLLEEQADFASFEPRLAESWEFSPDSLSITFHLRNDVFWSDGARVDAEDVRFTWILQTDTLVAWPSRSVKTRITDVEVIGEYAVKFHYASRYPYQLMDANDGAILPRHILAEVPRARFSSAEFGRRPVGDGPFVLARWENDQFIELERNPYYFERGLPYLDRVIFRIVPDMTTLVTQLETGEIDCLEGLPVDAVSNIEKNHPDIGIYSYPSRQQVFIAWNLEDPLFESREVRRALAMAVNVDEMIETLWAGRARAADSPLHPILWAHDPDMTRIPFDPGAARAHLAANGWLDTDGDGVLDRGGERFEFEMITNQGNRLRVDIMTMAQEYLRRIGVRVKPRAFEWNTFVERITSGEFESCVFGWKAATRVDLTDLWSSASAPPGGYNLSRYRSATVDSLIDLAKNTPDPGAARRLWFDCQRLIYDDQPVLFVAVPHEVVGLRRGYCGVEPSALGFFVDLEKWYVGGNCQ
jgi:peptide/nickel transport system substrate-binding protein